MKKKKKSKPLPKPMVTSKGGNAKGGSNAPVAAAVMGMSDYGGKKAIASVVLGRKPVKNMNPKKDQ